MAKKRAMPAIKMFETIVSHLHGQRQVYRFFDRLATCSSGTEINQRNMQAFLERYPQYHEKLKPSRERKNEPTNARP